LRDPDPPIRSEGNATLHACLRRKNRIDTSADLILTSLGSDEAVEEVYGKLFKGQEVSFVLAGANIG